MCYSATASFLASGALFGVGVLTQKKRAISSNQQPLAAIPFLFSAQQFAEGISWLGVSNTVPGWAMTASMYFYVVIALTLWPTYVPFAIMSLDKKGTLSFPLVQVTLKFLLLLGVAVGLYLLWGFTIYSQLSIRASCNGSECSSLIYSFTLPLFQRNIEYLYFLPAVVPFLLSRSKRIRFILAPLYFISFPVGIFFSESSTLPSVWCFIAALISMSIFFVFDSKTRLRNDALFGNRKRLPGTLT